MKRSTGRILTTHAGSLPRPNDLIEINRARLSGESYDEMERTGRLRQAVADVVRAQTAAGVDILNDGEFGKASRAAVDYGAWGSYVFERLAGFQIPETASTGLTAWDSGPGTFTFASRRREEEAFAEFYGDAQGAGIGTIRRPVCVGPISYQGQEALQADLANLTSALKGVQPEDIFVSAAAPGSIEVFTRGQNRYYPTDEAYLAALSEAMSVEYRAIVEAGFILQLDDPGLPDAWDMLAPAPTVAEYRTFAMLRIEALNAALAGIPEDRVRYHICWGSWHGPHTTDIPLRDIVDTMLKVKAAAYSVESGNVRHEHEWRVWEEAKLPPGKLLIPGVVSHATNVVEHPQLVADRIVRYAQLVGRENVLAGTDCGLGGRVHPQIAWAKLKALSEGAELASRQLWH